MEWLLAALVPILIAALKSYGTTKLQSLFSTSVAKLTPWLLKRWKTVSVILISISAGCLVGWWVKSPEIIREVDVQRIPELIERVTTIEVQRPNNCEHPEPPRPEDIQTADGLILYLRTEHEFKYRACLDSLDP